MEKKLREIPFKNYIILGVIILVSIFLLFYFYMWVEAYNESKLNKPIMDKYMDVINYNELDNYIIENPNTIIYVSVLENTEIRDFEKKFKRLFKNNEITNDILYLDITEELKNKKTREELRNKYSINSVSILDVPVFLVFDDGVLKSVYSISGDNYSVDGIKLFINNIKFTSDGDLVD